MPSESMPRKHRRDLAGRARPAGTGARKIAVRQESRPRFSGAPL